jgi:hypothetical protein
MKLNLLSIYILVVATGLGMTTVAEETTIEKAETGTNKATDKVKSSYRNVEDRACEMINGKMECAGKKIKHKIKNGSDEIKTETKELKDKVD